MWTGSQLTWNRISVKIRERGTDAMTLTTVLIDISAISVLLLLAFLIRQKIPFFYKYYIPTSLIAGILGLLLGPQVLLSLIHI